MNIQLVSAGQNKNVQDFFSDATLDQICAVLIVAAAKFSADQF